VHVIYKCSQTFTKGVLKTWPDHCQICGHTLAKLVQKCGRTFAKGVFSQLHPATPLRKGASKNADTFANAKTERTGHCHVWLGPVLLCQWSF
jgi:hypothetical protein